GVLSQLGLFGDFFKALAPFIALSLPFLTAPLLAYATKGKYYLVKNDAQKLIVTTALETGETPTLIKCEICENHFDKQDMTYCPFYADNICSLRCALDVDWDDKSREKAHVDHQTYAFFSSVLPESL